jgi:type I restriction enzyme S subunit
MGDWKEYDFLSLLDDPVRNGIYKKKEFHGSGCKIVNMGELFAFPRLGNVEMKRVELSTKEKERYLLQPGDLIFARRSLTERGAGKCSIIKSISEDTTFESSIIRARPNLEIASPDYIYYYFNSPYGKYLLGTILRQVAVAGITGSDLMQLRLKIPPLPEQKAIASVLSSLDDKIDLLHRQNKTLEAMAETLFRQWFVEEAQEDWEEGCLGDIADNIRDGVSHNNIASGTIYIGLEHIDRKNISLNNFGYSDNLQSNKYLFQENDILFGKLRPYFHKVTFASFSGVCSTDILVIRAKSTKLFNYCLFGFYQSDVVEYANLGSEGTRMPRTNWNTLKQYPILIPDDSLLDKYNEIVTHSINKIKHNQSQIRTLEKLRDTLLPKLMSGEVRVSI